MEYSSPWRRFSSRGTVKPSGMGWSMRDMSSLKWAYHYYTKIKIDWTHNWQECLTKERPLSAESVALLHPRNVQNAWKVALQRSERRPVESRGTCFFASKLSVPCAEMCKTFLLNSENHFQNVALPTPKLHYGAIFQPAIPETKQDWFYTTL